MMIGMIYIVFKILRDIIKPFSFVSLTFLHDDIRGFPKYNK